MKYILILTAIGLLTACTSTQTVESVRQPQQVIGEVDKPVDYKEWAMELNQKYLADEQVNSFQNDINTYLNSKTTKDLIAACNNESQLERLATNSCSELLNSCKEKSESAAENFNAWVHGYERHIGNSIREELVRLKSDTHIEISEKKKIVQWLQNIQHDFGMKTVILGGYGFREKAEVVMSAQNKIAYIEKKGKAGFFDNKAYALGCMQSLKDDAEKNKKYYKSVTFSDK